LNVDWNGDVLVNIEREVEGIDLLVIDLVYEGQGAIVLGLAADAAKPELPRADRSILKRQLSSRNWSKRLKIADEEFDKKSLQV
jgi:hypothetical protein